MKGGAIVASLLFPPRHHPCNLSISHPRGFIFESLCCAKPSKYFAVPEMLVAEKEPLWCNRSQASISLSQIGLTASWLSTKYVDIRLPFFGKFAGIQKIEKYIVFHFSIWWFEHSLFQILAKCAKTAKCYTTSKDP